MSSFFGLVAALAVLAFAPTAFAQDSSERGYGGKAGDVQTQVASGANAVNPAGTGPSAEAEGGLPFTGLDLAAAIGGGLLLLASGMALSRLVSRETAA